MPSSGGAEGSPEDRDSSVGLTFSVAIELKRRRGVFHDRFEARMTGAAISVVAAAVIIIALLQVFSLLRQWFP